MLGYDPKVAPFKVTRRVLMTTVLAAAVPSSAVEAQSSPHVGFLLPGTPASHGAYVATFLKGLSEVGLVSGINFTLDLRYAEGQQDRVPMLIKELVDSKVAVLAVGSTGASLAAKRATAEIPIVFASGDDPVRVGLVSSVKRPGGNVTGVSLFAAELTGKRLQLLIELVPSAGMMGLLVNPSNSDLAPVTSEALAAAHDLKRELCVVRAATDSDLEPAFASLVQQKAAVLMVDSDPFLNSRRNQIVALAARHGIAGNYPLREYVQAGGMTSYGVAYADSYRQAGNYAARILKGAVPADLPILQPVKFELAINLRAAKALGIDVPPAILAIADDVIE